MCSCYNGISVTPLYYQMLVSKLGLTFINFGNKLNNLCYWFADNNYDAQAEAIVSHEMGHQIQFYLIQEWYNNEFINTGVEPSAEALLKKIDDMKK